MTTRKASRLGAALLDLLFPPRCAFCRRVGVHGVCADCGKSLPFAAQPLHEDAQYGRCVAPLRYEGAVREALLRFKFRGAQSAAEGFGALLAQAVAEELPGAFDLVTYVPVSDRRRRERGYDQSFLLARETAKHWDAAPVALLRKTFDNPPQSTRSGSAERRGNVLGVYEAADPAAIRGARILLIDDILTTGATLGECVRVLRAAGASDVVCAALAAAELRK